MTVEADESRGKWTATRRQWCSLSRGAAAIGAWITKRRTRRRLGELSPKELRDIGLTREAVRAEVRKSWFWD